MSAAFQKFNASVAALLFLSSSAVAACAQTIEHGTQQTRPSLKDLAPVSDAELTEMRGGYFTAGGVNFDFGATVKTLVDGDLALQSTIQWTQAGVVVQQTQGTAPNATQIPQADLANLTGAGTNPVVAPTGVRISTPSGTTDVVANFSAGQVQNLLVNTASNQSITQNTAVTLTVYNFSAWQAQMAQHLASTALANDLLAARSSGSGP